MFKPVCAESKANRRRILLSYADLDIENFSSQEACLYASTRSRRWKFEHLVELLSEERTSPHPDQLRRIVIGLDALSIPISDDHGDQGHREG